MNISNWDRSMKQTLKGIHELFNNFFLTTWSGVGMYIDSSADTLTNDSSSSDEAFSSQEGLPSYILNTKKEVKCH